MRTTREYKKLTKNMPEWLGGISRRGLSFGNRTSLINVLVFSAWELACLDWCAMRPFKSPVDPAAACSCRMTDPCKNLPVESAIVYTWNNEIPEWVKDRSSITRWNGLQNVCFPALTPSDSCTHALSPCNNETCNVSRRMVL